jgi:aryl-alcohol dehydrogenase-like predicted oxidoreductase
MRLRALGPMRISPVGVGTAPIGSDPAWFVDWGAQDERDAVAAIHAALDAGVNWIDTAPFYGWGRAEEIVGRALRRRRDDVLVFTKCGTFRNADGSAREDLRPESVRADVEASLRRLQTDHVDLLQLHDPDPAVGIEETWGAVHQLIREGLVRHGGISNHPPELVARALAVGPVAALQHQYSLLARDIEEGVVGFAERDGLRILCWAPLASGFLAEGFDVDGLEPTDFRRRHPFASLDLAPLRSTLAGIAHAHDGTSAQVAIAWVLSRSAVGGAIVGVRNPAEAAALSGAAGLELHPDEVAALAAAAAP